jgi:regulator of sigma E protease
MSNSPAANFVDSQQVPVILDLADKEQNIPSKSAFRPNDKILSINNKQIKGESGLRTELMTYAGYSGDMNFSVMRDAESDPIIITLTVDDFLPKESQKESVEYLAKYLEVDIGFRNNPIIGKVFDQSAAFEAELKPGDLVLEIAGEDINFAEDIVSVVAQNPNTTLDFKIERNDEIIYKPVNIRSQDNVGSIGVSFRESRSFFEALSIGIYETYNHSITILKVIGKMITGNVSTENLSGPIGIAQMAGNMAQAGIAPFILLMGLLSISLAVLNLLPIPVLDGGQLTLLGVEAIRGKPLPEKAENIIYTGGAALVIMLMIFAVFNDVARFF